jgi:hypothetical protein
MTEFEKEMSHDFVMLSDSWTAKLKIAGRDYKFYKSYSRGCLFTKREDQMLTRMDRNFGDSM